MSVHFLKRFWIPIVLGLGVLGVIVYMSIKVSREDIATVASTNPNTREDPPCPHGSEQCPSGDCKLLGDLYGMC
jgi:hypothetical protein